MKSKSMLHAASAVGGMAALAAANVFLWNGGSAGWSTNNWTPNAECSDPDCWPKTANDDAVVEGNTFMTLTFSESLTVDDVTLESGGQSPTITFTTTNETAYTVTANSVTITNAIVYMADLAGMIGKGSDPCG